MTVPNFEDGKVFYLNERELAEGREVVTFAYDIDLLDQFIALEDQLGIPLEAIWFRRVTRDALGFGWVTAESLVGIDHKDTEFWREDRDTTYGWVKFQADSFIIDPKIRAYCVIPQLKGEDSDIIGLRLDEKVLVIYRS